MAEIATLPNNVYYPSFERCPQREDYPSSSFTLICAEKATVIDIDGNAVKGIHI